jgi:hypothetical protein
VTQIIVSVKKSLIHGNLNVKNHLGLEIYFSKSDKTDEKEDDKASSEEAPKDSLQEEPDKVSK